MKWRVFVLVWCLASAAWAAGPSVRVSLASKQPVLVGQQVHLLVTVVTPNYFTSAPPFPPLAVPGAIVTMPDETGTNATETIGGATYASIRKTYIFAAQQAGDFTLPPAEIAFTYGGDDGKPQHAKVKLPPFKITARLPPGAAAAASAAGGAVVPVARVTIRQQFDRAGATFHVGEALVRTLDTTVEHTQAMMIPPPQAEAPDGVRVFAADPVLTDQTSDREGLVAGHRTDRLTYVFEKTGNFMLPAVRVVWFDASAGQSRTAEALALDVTVAPGPPATGAIAPEAASVAASAVAARPGHRWRVVDVARAVAAGAFAMLVLLVAGRWLGRHVPAWRARRAARRAERATSEPVRFAALQAALHKGRPAEVYAAALQWAPGGMSAWVAACGDDALSDGWRALQAAVWAPAVDTPWNAAAFGAALHRCRDVARRAAAQRDARAALPALNF